MSLEPGGTRWTTGHLIVAPNCQVVLGPAALILCCLQLWKHAWLSKARRECFEYSHLKEIINMADALRG